MIARSIDLGDDRVLSIWTVGDSITEGANNGYRNRTSMDDVAAQMLVLSDDAALQVADLYDGIHPTREAHDAVADAWLAVLTPLLVPP